MCRGLLKGMSYDKRSNSPRLSHYRILEGNEFHRRGPAVAKYLSSKVLCDSRTAHIAVSVERSRRMLMSTLSDELTDVNQSCCRRIRMMWSRRCAPFTSYQSRGDHIHGWQCEHTMQSPTHIAVVHASSRPLSQFFLQSWLAEKNFQMISGSAEFLRSEQIPAQTADFCQIRLAEKNFRLIFGLAEFYGHTNYWELPTTTELYRQKLTTTNKYKYERFHRYQCFFICINKH